MNKDLFMGYENTKQGFTLIELLVVISIIAVLASVVLSALGGAQAKARDAARTETIGEYKKAIELSYDADGGVYPRPIAGDTPFYCLGDYTKCGVGVGVNADASINTAVKRFISPLPPIKETTIILLPSVIENMKGVMYKCNDTSCSSATIQWGLEKDKSCPGGTISPGYERVCQFIFN